MLEQIDHVNIVVDDLEKMVDFYHRLLGFAVTKRVTISGPWVDATVGLHDAVGDVVYLELPTGPRVELIRYARPKGLVPEGIDRSNTRGLRHLAFRVSDIDAAVRKLLAADVRPLSAVQSVPDSQVTYSGGVRKRLLYFRDPEGNLLELCEYRSASG
jgi:catechol 2,3-dioxygenase-like lactoylglutathione lyase family enzyme